MGIRKRAGRDLCGSKSRGEKQYGDEKKKTPQHRRSSLFAVVTSDSRLVEDQDTLRLSTPKQQLRAWALKNNTVGRFANRETGICVYFKKTGAHPSVSH